MTQATADGGSSFIDPGVSDPIERVMARPGQTIRSLPRAFARAWPRSRPHRS